MDKILIIEGSLIKTNLPEGKTQAEILEMVKKEFGMLKGTVKFFNKDVKIYGKIPSSISLWLGWKLGRTCNSVSAFDPRTGIYVLVIGENKNGLDK